MEEVAPIFIHQSHTSRFCEAPQMGRKRDISYQTSSFMLQQQQQQQLHPLLHTQQQFASGGNNWNPQLWDWDRVNFVAKPLETEILHLGNNNSTEQRRNNGETNGSNEKLVSRKTVVMGEEDESLQLNLGVSLTSVEVPVSRPSKKARSGSPGNGNYPKCQVDNCEEDLSNAKDYHRRHKVCETHSKFTKALVGKQMQRFCQQCSRFHPLSEFDEGKRSCRRRLAGHNRRRRKCQPEDVNTQPLHPGNHENTNTDSLLNVHLLTALASAQGQNKTTSVLSLADRDQLVQIVSKINSLPLATDLASKLQLFGNISGINSKHLSSNLQEELNLTSLSTTNLLAVLSATLATSSPDALAFVSEQSSQSSDSAKTRLTSPDQAAATNLQKSTPGFPSVGGERSSSSYQSRYEDSDGQVHDTRSNLPLQLFSSSPENDSPPELTSSRKYFSSDSSNPIDDRSPSSSPIEQKLFPMHTLTEKKHINIDVNATAEGSRTRGLLPFDLNNRSNMGADNSPFKSFPYHAGYTSSSGSDHSPPSLNSDPQDRTGRIMFKLFGKDPSHFPETLRRQIYNWLCSSPSEMESYIRPGCVILSIYVSMSFGAWQKFERDLLQRVNCLVQDSESDFWRKARFLVHTGRQLASHRDGKLRLCKSWRKRSSPELISVSPLAVVSGQDTVLSLRGQHLTDPGTEIRCTYMGGGYTSMQVTDTSYLGTMYSQINLAKFKIQGAHPDNLGRFFIEVENGFKGNSFPVIIADAAICKELRLLESEFIAEAKDRIINSAENAYDFGQPRLMEEVLHFMNELGWLFQKKMSPSIQEGVDYSLKRFKYLLVFCIERDWCALVKAVLDMLVERNLRVNGLTKESLDILGEIKPLNRAIKRRSREMVDLLINYSVSGYNDGLKNYIFPPNVAGPGGITPLHLVACTSGSETMVDALTNDPQEIGLSSWTNLLDANEQSPYSYALMTKNHSYNRLVTRKLSGRRNDQVSVTIIPEPEQSAWSVDHKQRAASGRFNKSCARCATITTKYTKRVPTSNKGLLNQPYLHSMLAIAAVCVCVCLFLRGSPDFGLVAPFKWDNLDFGTI